MKNIIEVKNVNKIYKLYKHKKDRLKEALSPSRKKYHKDFYALKKIDFNVKSGEVIGLVGENGAGKSTLLKVITSVLTPNNGEVNVEGKISALIELGAGFNPDYTGMENIYLYGTLMGLKKEEIKRKIDSILDFADIGDFIYQPVKTYSSGMFARISFSVAINVDPDILIVDEALSVGDVFFQAKCYKKFDEFKKNGKTILFVTHDMSTIIKYCDRAVLLHKGQILKSGEPRDIIDAYKKLLVNEHEKEEEVLEEKKSLGCSWKENIFLNPNSLEYGDKTAEIMDFGLFDEELKITNNIYKNSMFYIKIKVKFNEKILDPIFAFTIKDIKGNEITGTNTMVENINTNEIEAGDIVEVSFFQKMTLQGGVYLLSLGCTGYKKENLSVYHRLYDICDINVISSKNTIGFLDMNSDIDIIKSKEL